MSRLAVRSRASRLSAAVLVLGVLAAGVACDAEPAPPRFRAPATTGPAGPVPPSPPATPPGWSDPGRVGQPYGEKVRGLLTFRGNPTRTFLGTGPIPRTTPVQRWRFPKSGGLCAISVDESGPRQWCGAGWTGQPAVFERGGRTWVVFGAYDRALHFLDADTGGRLLPDLPTGDIIKGSVTIDPDGYPLVYSGSRDNYYRVVAIDRGRPTELWKLHAHAVSPTKWNDDWDGSGLIIDDYLFIGGENSQFHIVKLNRGYDAAGKVTVRPKLVFNTPGWDAQQLRDIGHGNVSIENSVAIYRDVVYFANSGGLVQGWDISGLKQGAKPERVFRFWTGDDTDASIVIDAQGMLYVASEYERGSARSKQIGQMIKLDPSRPTDPVVWKIDDYGSRPAGLWTTPTLHGDLVIFYTHAGEVLGVDRASGARRWTFRMRNPSHASPVVVDGILVLADCDGSLHAYDATNPDRTPSRLWTFHIGGGCIESTPAVWNGVLYFGSRAGGIHALGAG